MTTLLLALAAFTASADNTVTITDIEFEKELPYASSRVSAEFPLGEDGLLRRAIIDYILEGCRTTYPGVQIEQPSNTCDEPTFKKYLEDYTTVLCQLCAEDHQDYVNSLDEEDKPYEVAWYSYISFQKEADTDQYVSYTVYHGTFTGGALPESGSEAVTISKADGIKIDSIFKEGAEEEMQPLLWKYLLISEEPEDPEEYIAGINQFLEANYGDKDHLPIPYSSTFLAPDGVHLQYQPFEIGFWPIEPIVVIPFDEVKPFLADEAARLVVNSYTSHD